MEENQSNIIPEDILNNIINKQGFASYSLSDHERVIMVIFNKLKELEKQILELQKQKIIETTQLPETVLEENNLLPTLSRETKGGCGYRPILRSEIEYAKSKSPFARQQAKILGRSYGTYKKYCKKYDLWNPQPFTSGKRSPHSPEIGKYAISKILSGELNNNPKITDYLVKDKLIRSGLVPIKCAVCGYDKQRSIDGKVPLLLDHINGDMGDFKKENIRLLCTNCTFECGRGYIRQGARGFDVDWMQGKRK